MWDSFRLRVGAVRSGTCERQLRGIAVAQDQAQVAIILRGTARQEVRHYRMEAAGFETALGVGSTSVPQVQRTVTGLFQFPEPG